MVIEKTLKDTDDIGLLQRRFSLLTVARYRDKSRIKRAIEIQDALRKKSTGWDSTKELRTWRDARHGPARS